MDVNKIFKDWERRLGTYVRANEKTPEEVALGEDNWFLVWLERDHDLTPEQKDEVRNEFDRRQKVKDVARAKEAAGQEILDGLDSSNQQAFQSWLGDDEVTAEAVATWRESVAAEERQATARRLAYAQQAAIKVAERKQRDDEDAEAKRRLAVEQAAEARSTFNAHVADPVWLRGEDAASLRALAAFRRLPGIRFTITNDDLRAQADPAHTQLSAEVRTRNEEIHAATQQRDAERVRRLATGEPDVVIPAPIDVAAIADPDPIARWLVAHAGQYELSVARTSVGGAVHLACWRWGAWQQLEQEATKADPATAAKIRNTAYAVITLSASVSEFDTLHVAYGVPDRLVTLLEDQQERWDFRASDDGGGDAEDTPKTPRRAKAKTQEEINDQAAVMVYRMNRDAGIKRNAEHIAGQMRAAGAKGEDRKLVKLYRAVEADPDAFER